MRYNAILPQCFMRYACEWDVQRLDRSRCAGHNIAGRKSCSDSIETNRQIKHVDHSYISA